MKIQEVKNIMLEGLRPFADEYGYKINKGRFGIFSKNKNPLTSINFTYNTWGFEVQLFPYVSVDYKIIHEICEKCGFPLNYCAFINLFLLEEIHKHGWHKGLRNQMGIDQTNSLSITESEFSFEYMRKEKPKARDKIIFKEGDEWIEHCNAIIASLLPYAVDYINRLSDIEGLDRLYNSLPINYYNPNCIGFDYHCMVGLISAKLAHNPQYDKIKDTYTAIVKKKNLLEETRQSFFRLVDYLDTTGL